MAAPAATPQGVPVDRPAASTNTTPGAVTFQGTVPQTVDVPDRSPLDDPWLGGTARKGAELEPSSGACDPWSRARCSEELSDPWATDMLSIGPSTHESEAHRASAPPPPDLRLLLRSEEVLVEVDVDWEKADVDSSCVPQTAAVSVRGLLGQTRVSGHQVGTVNSIDAWVIDLGAPEEPYE